MNISKRITTLREKEGMTISELAYASGISQSYIKRIELGESRKISIIVLEDLCFGLNISIKDFFDFESEDEELADYMKQLSYNQKVALLNFVRTVFRQR